MRGETPASALWKSWRESPPSIRLKTRYTYMRSHTHTNTHVKFSYYHCGIQFYTLLSYNNRIVPLLSICGSTLRRHHTCRQSHKVKARVKVHVFLPHGWACVWVSVCLLLLCVSVTWLARVLVFLYMCVCASPRVCVGLLCDGFLPVEWPRDVRVRASSQHSLLQEKVPGVGQVRGAALPPRR